MSESENLAVVRRAYSALDADDVETFLAECAPDIEWLYPPTPGIPYSGLWSGPEGVERFLETHDEVEEILEWTRSQFIAQGDWVVVLGHYRGAPKPAGQEWETDFVDVLTMCDGKIARFEAFFDTAAGVEARSTARTGPA